MVSINRFAFCCCLLLVRLTWVFGGFDVGLNLTDFLRHRERRGLIFENGGSIKLSMGPIFPLGFEDPIEWRSFVTFYNIFVGDYPLPTQPLYPWDKWETLYARAKQQTKIQPDDSREFIYIILENVLSRNHVEGKECLLRSICENAQIHHHIDVVGEILNIILTPGKENMDTVYKNAHEMGKAGTDCIKYFIKCPKGLNILDQIVHEF